MTWQASASDNVRKALLLELTMLLDGCIELMAEVITGELERRYAAHLDAVLNELINGTDTDTREYRGVLDSRRGAKRTRRR